MPRIIDTIHITARLREVAKLREFPFQGDGLQVILDPATGTAIPHAPYGFAVIIRPDGSSLTVPIAGATVSHGVAALYFAALQPTDVPRLSEVEW